MNIEDLVAEYPRLYHMAERGSWPSIETHGLWSTSAILDRHRISGHEREIYESRHRPGKIPVRSPHFPRTVLRDQIPMSDASLKNCLNDGLSPQDWYEFLNAKTFFWATYDRLLKLLNADAYKNDEHDVLIVDTASLIKAHANQITLCHINSGCSKPWVHMRSKNVFQSIEDYPAKRNGRPQKTVAELVVEYGVPDIAQHVISVQRMRSNTVLGTLK